MFSEQLAEEFEVLESIYPDELTKVSNNAIEIIVEPDEHVSGVEDLKLILEVQYPERYPDILPDFSFHILQGSLEDEESESLLEELKTIGEENIGMAMTFTLVSYLREKLPKLLQVRVERQREAEKEQERLELEAEEARTRGTPVTPESFLIWKKKFEKEAFIRKSAEQEERLRSLPSKEREELRKIGTRLTGRQLFEQDRNLATSDATLVEEGTESIDVSQYDRTDKVSDEGEDERLQFSDSD